MRSSSPRRGGILKGCLIALGIMAVIALAVGIYIWTHWKGWAADAAKTVARQAIEQSELTAEEKKHVLDRIDAFADDFKNGKVTMEQVGNVFKELADGPLLGFAMVEAAESKYIKPSALSDKEKKAGRRSLDRFQRGVYEKKIPNTALQEILEPLETTEANGQKKLKDTVTTDELKAFLAAAKKKADDAKIQDEAFKIDVPKEIDKAFDKALGTTSSGK